MIYTGAPLGRQRSLFSIDNANGLDEEQEFMLQWSGTRCPESRAWTIPRGASDRFGCGTPLADARRLEEIFRGSRHQIAANPCASSSGTASSRLPHRRVRS